ncbi:unnamed protein product [Oikopleura dioica]|uniref:Protein FAM32A n=1 Tax=Oikopleura dioica TaxID=34765 RepID=E4Y8Y5_OIKDI|nr:unnamed protein product [Oikopleura dioica]
MADDPYAFVSGGALKLKTDSSGKISKRKEKKSKKKKKKRNRSASPEPGKGLDKLAGAPNYRFANPVDSREPWNPGDVPGSTRTDPVEEPDDYRPMLTATERKFHERQREREMDRILKKAGKSHKEKVEDYNRKLADIAELQFDIPKISWTK